MTNTPTPSRRDQLAAERGAIAAAREATVKPRTPHVPRSLRHPKPVRRVAKRHRVKPTLSVLTMLFVLALAVVTSIPINSFLSPADIAAASAPEFKARDFGEQSLAVVSGGADTPISRDNFTVTSLKSQLVAQTAGRGSDFTNDPNGSIQWPFAVGVPTTDQFGPRVLCDTCGVTQHQGVDFTPGNGAPIQIIAAGVVRSVTESDEGLGVHVIIDHQIDGQLVSSVYCHMQFGSVAVSEGETVTVGQLVGRVGETGFAFGPHLHFEIRLNGTENVDPFAWLQAHVN